MTMHNTKAPNQQSVPAALTLSQAAAQAPDQVLGLLSSGPQGLSSAQAASRLAANGPNVLPSRKVTWVMVLWRQVKSPILLLLVVAAVLSFVTGDRADASIILVILLASVGLGFGNEWRAERQASSLHDQVSHTVVVVRDGKASEVPVADLVVGDVVRLSLGAVVPADLRLLSATDLSCDEAVVTGESVASDKSVEPVKPDAALGDLSSALLMGTVVHSGSGEAVAVATGADCVFGHIAASLATELPQTGFQRGLSKFSMFLLYVALTLTVLIFVGNALLHRPLLDALLFALVIAVGITPQLLPAVVNTSLAAGAAALAKQDVLVKRLACIEDLGNVDILVTDKTGTLTQGKIGYQRAVPAQGHDESELERLGLLACETDFTQAGASPVGQNEIDRALSEQIAEHTDLTGWQRLQLRPFDHDSRTSAVLGASGPDEHLHILKGAPESVLPHCAAVAPADLAQRDALFAGGSRTIAVATRNAGNETSLPATIPDDFTLIGYLAFLDQPKPDAGESLQRLAELGVAVKVATGDNLVVAEKVCRDLGLEVGSPLTGDAIDAMADDELYDAVHHTALLARVSPDHKARIITVLRRHHTVAFLGDGVNDAPALHRSDVGISVDTATDVAKDAADVVLLKKDLGVIIDGIVGGRRTFANTIKYVMMGTSSNFGNMFSASIASIVLPFLPMLPSQLLFNNLLYDTSQLAIPTDAVDDEALRKPAHWDIGRIRKFMVMFGPVSSLFDFLTFALMLLVFHAGQAEFRAGWFVESLATQTLIVLVIRTRRIPFFRSRPSTAMLVAVLGVVAIGAAIPYLPFATAIGFAPLPWPFFAALVGIVLVYLLLVEGMKWLYYRERPAGETPVAHRDTSALPPAAILHTVRRQRRIARRANRFQAHPSRPARVG